MRSTHAPEENTSTSQRIDSKLNGPKARRRSHQFSRRCRIAIMIMIWIATCVPSNIIAAIFFFKNMSTDSSQLEESPVVDTSSHDEHIEMGDQNIEDLTFYYSSDEVNYVVLIFLVLYSSYTSNSLSISSFLYNISFFSCSLYLILIKKQFFRITLYI